MKTLFKYSNILIQLLINLTLDARNSQDKMVNKMCQSDYPICYAMINNYDSIPYLEVDGR